MRRTWNAANAPVGPVVCKNPASSSSQDARREFFFNLSSSNEFHLAGWLAYKTGFDREASPHVVRALQRQHVTVKSCPRFHRMCSVRSANQRSHICSAWMKSQLHDVCPTTAPLITAFQARATPPSDNRSDSWRCCCCCCCDSCNVSCGRLFAPERAVTQIKPCSFPPLQKTKSFGVIPQSGAKAESQLSPIRSLNAVMISLEVLDEYCPD